MARDRTLRVRVLLLSTLASVCALTFGGVLVTPASAQDVNALRQEVPSDQMAALERASLANLRKDYQGAVDILQPIASWPSAHHAVFVFLGEMYERLDQPGKAADAFATALTRPVGPGIKLPGNLQWKFGRALVKAGRSGEAIEPLLKALEQAGYETDERVFDDLASAYQSQGNVAALAVRARLLCANPLDETRWQALRSLRERPSSEWTAPPRVSPEDWCPTRVMIELGPPQDWSYEAKSRGVPAYLAAANQLLRDHHRQLALRYLITVAQASVGSPSVDEMLEDPSRLLAALDAFTPHKLSPAARYLVLAVIMDWHQESGRYAHAVSALQQAAQAAIDLYREDELGTELKEASKLASNLARNLFAFVSFEPRSGQPRSRDAAEFVSMRVGDDRDKAVVSDDYGSVSHSEDWANMFTVASLKKARFNGKVMDMPSMIEACFAARRFEIPVKYFLMGLSLGASYDGITSEGFDVDIAKLERAIAGAPPDQIRPTTLEAYELGRRINRVLKDVHTAQPIGVASVAFSPDGTQILTTTNNGVLAAWDAQSGRPLGVIPGKASSVRFSRDGKLMLAIDGDRLKILDAAGSGRGREVKTPARVDSATFSPDGRQILVVSQADAFIYDVADGRQIRHINRFNQDLLPVSSIAASPDGRYLAIGTHALTDEVSFKVFVWEARSGKAVARLNGHTSIVGSLTFSSDSRYILSGSSDGTARLWSVETWKEVKTYEGHSETIEAVAISPDGRTIATASWDNSVRVWDRESAKVLHEVTSKGFWFVTLDFSPDGKRLAVGSYDGTATVFDIDPWRQIARIPAGRSSQ